MSADQGSVEAPAAPAAPAAEGPVIITVAGQDTEGSETPAAEPKVETQQNEPPKAAGSEEPADNRDDKGRFKPNGVQDRIDELTRARREAEREAEYWKARAGGADQPGKPAAPTQPQQPVAPTRDKYATDAEYLDAKAEYLVEQKLAQREQQSQAQAQAAAKAQSWNDKLVAARADIPDFDAVMNGSTQEVAGHVAELIMEHDMGAKVAHFFAANPEALEKVNAMSPAKAAFEIGKVAAKFEAAAQQAVGSFEPAAEVKVSKAPPPASRQVGGGAATAPSLEDLDMEAYVARRKAMGASWAR